MAKGNLYIVSGQSGVGKNTLLKEMLSRNPDYVKIITYTTRKPRPGEIPNRDHFFIPKEKFIMMINNNQFIEYAEVHGQMYGTAKKQIYEIINQGRNAFMEIDVQGASQIKKIIPEAILIFVKFDQNDLEQAIRRRIVNDPKRGETPEEEIQKRINTARQEIEYEKGYDYVIVNPEGHPEKAIEEIESIIKAQ